MHMCLEDSSSLKDFEKERELADGTILYGFYKGVSNNREIYS